MLKLQKSLSDLSDDEVTHFISRNEELSKFISKDVWNSANFNGNRLSLLAQGNKIVYQNAKKNLKLDDGQMAKLIDFLKKQAEGLNASI